MHRPSLPDLPARPVAPQWSTLDQPVWRRSFQMKLSVAIPVIMTSLVILMGLLEVHFISRIFKSTMLDPQDYQRLLPLLETARHLFLITVAGTAIIAAIVSHAITAPIHRLVKHAKTLATGDLASRITVRSSDEFSVLETAFNEMASSLKNYQSQMEEYNRTLEERVTARTSELSTVLGLSKSMLFTPDQERLLRLIATLLHDVTRYDLCAVCLTTEDGAEVHVRSMGRLDPRLLAAFLDRIRQEMARVGGVTLPGDHRLRVDLVEAQEEGADRDLAGALGGITMAPLTVGTVTTGVIALGTLDAAGFDEHVANLLTIVANHAALAVENAKGYARLKELDRLKSEFVSTVSHELRTPLTSIKEGVELLNEPEVGPLNDQQGELVAIVRRNAQRLYILINDLLDLSKLESGEARFHKRPVALRDVVADTLGRLKIQADQKRLQLVEDLPADLPEVYGDPDKLAQVLTNLVGNAVKFTPEGGTIRVTARPDGELVETCVWNASPPLPAGELERIFDKFYQVGRTAGPGARGTGLGLSIAREIIQRHGGTIRARSDPAGNSFLFTVPRLNRLTYLTDNLAAMIDQAEASHTCCTLVRLTWEDADAWRARGGAAGVERVLQALEQTVGQTIQQQGLIDRLLRFGDEPALALLANTDADGAAALAAKAVEALLAHPITVDQQPVPLRCSARVAIYPQDGLTAEPLLQTVSVNGHAN